MNAFQALKRTIVGGRDFAAKVTALIPGQEFEVVKAKTRSPKSRGAVRRARRSGRGRS